MVCIKVYTKHHTLNIQVYTWDTTPVANVLSRLMDKLGVYNERSEGPMGDDFLQIHMVKECPQQNDSDSCGMFVMKMTEYLLMSKDVEYVRPEDINSYRIKMTTELLAHFGVTGA
ncbi:unnamed protein product [Cuscuta europaea]|uniref:Ubiquitin-like protease family profile domain-containing protein n=1 Tax=Cuscuta europaea TaxID=41803 RepID=A0A9P1EIB0_CUSEU|nr:unnamed protein product [Cuscuta europaea]